MRRRPFRGATIVEMAFSFVLVFTLLLAIMEFGRMMYAYNSVAYCATETARYAAVHGSNGRTVVSQTDLISFARRRFIALDTNSISVSANWQPDNSPGSKVTVSVSYVFTPIVPGFNRMVTVASRSTATILN